MAQDTLQRWSAGSLAKSINLHTPDFQSELELDSDTINLTSGINEGIGPRYGMAPLPGHSDQEVPTTGKFAGLMRYELGQAKTANTWTRVGIFAIYPIRMGGVGTDLGKTSTYYAFVISYQTDKQAGTFLDVLIASQDNLTLGTQEQSPNFFDGLPYINANLLAQENYILLDSELTQQGSTNAEKVTTLLNLTSIDNSKFVSSTQFVIAGIEVPQQWLFGEAFSTGDATHAPRINLISTGFAGLVNGGTAFVPCGFPPAFNYRNFPLSNRTVQIYALAEGNQNVDYQVSFQASLSTFLPAYQDGSPHLNIDLNAFIATKTSAGTAYGSTTHALYNDPAMTCNSAMQGVLSAAGGKAICTIFQDWYQNQFGNLNQFIDLQSNPLPPPAIASRYAEDGTSKSTSFAAWPSFVRGTAMTPDFGAQLGAADSGILRANTTYELSYSIFYKRLNYETNVGTPVKIQTGADDFVGLQLFSTDFAAPRSTVFTLAFYPGPGAIMPWPGTQTSFVSSRIQTQSPFHINYMEYRFYYRLEGTQEWLPAYFVDAAKFWFYPYFTPMLACTGSIGGLTGGAPGAFNDYSLLPKDNWTCVVMYKNRAFWLSDKSLVFGQANNVMAYAQRNSAACPVGAFRGAIVHAYYGQAEQDARLVIFGTSSTYVGKFTGDLEQVPVQISADTVANFGLDGSDFVINYWTSCTAFSYRAAVVAEGLLYFWGPQGIFMDDGVNPIQRISVPLEPDIFNFYDPAAVDQIKAIYNDTTKEIIWFYPPKVGDTSFPTYGLVFNTVRKTWLFTKFAGKIDDAQMIKIESSAMPTGGTRTIVYGRATTSDTIQRAEFFDQNNRAGDFIPGREMVVKQVSTPVAGQRRLTLAAGHTSLASIAAGDFLTIQQCARYATSMASPTDMISKVVAVNAGAGTIDILLPDDVTFDTAITFATNNLFFPVYQAGRQSAGLHGIPWTFSSKYWIPGGMGYWAYWLYLFLVAKIKLLPSVLAQTIGLQYRTPVSASFLTAEDLTLVNNSDANWQIYHPFTVGNQNFEGQGIRLRLSGIQIGSELVLQYVEAHATPLEGEQLKIFEG